MLFAGDDCASGAPIFTWVVGQGPRERPAGVFDRIPEDAGLSLRLTYRKGFDTEGLAFEDDPAVDVFPGPDRGRAAEMLVVGPGDTPLGVATLLSVLPPDGLDPGPEGFAVEAVAGDGTVTSLLRIRRFDADWSEKFAFREPLQLAAGTVLRVSHPGAIVDLIREPAAGLDERAP